MSYVAVSRIYLLKQEKNGMRGIDSVERKQEIVEIREQITDVLRWSPNSDVNA